MEIQGYGLLIWETVEIMKKVVDQKSVHTVYTHTHTHTHTHTYVCRVVCVCVCACPVFLETKQPKHLLTPILQKYKTF